MRLNERQQERLGSLIHCVLVDLRGIVGRGEYDQARLLVQMVHCIPTAMFTEGFSWSWLREDVARYERRWPGRYTEMVRWAEEAE